MKILRKSSHVQFVSCEAGDNEWYYKHIAGYRTMGEWVKSLSLEFSKLVSAVQTRVSGI